MGKGGGRGEEDEYQWVIFRLIIHRLSYTYIHTHTHYIRGGNMAPERVWGGVRGGKKRIRFVTKLVSFIIVACIMCSVHVAIRICFVSLRCGGKGAG